MSVVVSAQVVVTSAAAKVVSAQPFAQTVVINNRDAANSSYVGPAGVTSSTGTEIKANTQLGQGPIQVPPETELWLVTAAAQTARNDILQIEAN